VWDSSQNPWLRCAIKTGSASGTATLPCGPIGKEAIDEPDDSSNGVGGRRFRLTNPEIPFECCEALSFLERYFFGG
jgi:hypothetical protein